MGSRATGVRVSLPYIQCHILAVSHLVSGAAASATAVTRFCLPEENDTNRKGHYRPASASQPQLTDTDGGVAVGLQVGNLGSGEPGALPRVVLLVARRVDALARHDRVPGQRDEDRGRVDR